MLALSLQTVLTFSMPCKLLLKARQDALGKRNCYKQAFNDVALRSVGRGKGSILQPMSRSHYFSEPMPWATNFTGVFPVLGMGLLDC